MPLLILLSGLDEQPVGSIREKFWCSGGEEYIVFRSDELQLRHRHGVHEIAVHYETYFHRI